MTDKPFKRILRDVTTNISKPEPASIRYRVRQFNITEKENLVEFEHIMQNSFGEKSKFEIKNKIVRSGAKSDMFIVYLEFLEHLDREPLIPKE